MDTIIGLLQGIVTLGLIVALILGNWMVLQKAGQPGWSVLVPIYNIYTALKVAGRPGWWLVLFFIPLVNLIAFIIPFDIASRFGKGVGYGFGLLFLPFVFYPMLGFGNARYRG